ncbi:MAG: membrane-associated protein [Parcubacteria group bacterium Gr01-1014_66]|nr:MAG: membrane-associated protein [Parcubacteria group bacterium Gr01-1014_66]
MIEFFGATDLGALIQSIGYAGIFAIVTAESGFLIGIFLPGDSLLFTAGFLASQGYLRLDLVFLISFLGAVIGDAAGYAIGRRVGPKIFIREDGIFFQKRNIERTQLFYETHGAKTILIARFVPFVRTLAPVFAGVGAMRYARFAYYNIIGGFLWAGSMTLAGYFLGRVLPGADRFFLPIMVFVIFLSILPTLLHVWLERRRKDK